MTDDTEPSVPAGWYPDPWGSTQERWWNGTAWTEKLNEEALSETYEPAVTRSTYASATATATDPTGLPSRRALRSQTVETAPEPQSLPEPQPVASVPVSDFAAAPLPPLTQVPQFTPEPTASALPAPVFTDPEPVTPDPEPATVEAEPEPAAATSPAAPFPTHTDSHGIAAADDGWAASLRNWDSLEASTTPPDAVPIFGDAPPVSYTRRPTPYQALHGRTSPVWLIVVMPLIHVAATVGSLFLFPGLVRVDGGIPALVPTATGSAALQEWVVFAAAPLSLAFFLFTLIMGFQDRARLRLLGHEKTASPWWIVLHPLIYLIVRSSRVRAGTGRRGSGPLTTYLCLYVAPPLALVVTTAVITALDGALPS